MGQCVREGVGKGRYLLGVVMASDAYGYLNGRICKIDIDMGYELANGPRTRFEVHVEVGLQCFERY